jgi:hypothetical protein
MAEGHNRRDDRSGVLIRSMPQMLGEGTVDLDLICQVAGQECPWVIAILEHP